MSASFEEEFLALLAISPRVQDAIRALTLVPTPQKGNTAERNTDIISRINAGESRQSMATKHNLSIDRINQIMRGNTITQPKAKNQGQPQTTQAKPLTDREKEILRDWGADTSDEITTITAVNPHLAADVYQDIYENADLHATAKRFNITAIMAEKLYFAEEARRDAAFKRDK